VHLFFRTEVIFVVSVKETSRVEKRKALETETPATQDNTMHRHKSESRSAFAPAFRANDADVHRQHDLFLSKAALVPVLDAVPFSVVVLNHWRQIIYTNKAMLALVGQHDMRSILGKRLGEVVGCTHALEAPGGCGTTDFCLYCGAVHAMLRAIEVRRPDVQECRISCAPNRKAQDLRVWSRPITVEDEAFVVFSLLDIAAEKRKEVLEHLFFHDIANTAGGLSGLAELLPSADPDRIVELAGMIHRFSRQLIEEIEGQRELLMAESGTLTVHPETLDMGELVEVIAEGYRHHPSGRGKRLEFSSPPTPIIVKTDRALAGRIIGNMIRNAIEAAPRDGLVTIHCSSSDAGAQVDVHNPGHMPKHVQLQLFKRSFSTKGEGRGLGTYSMKLLGEQYLKGRIDFVSAPATGTTFRVTLPSMGRT
jgi:nitrogen-specific signal transduction histidine kinase